MLPSFLQMSLLGTNQKGDSLSIPLRSIELILDSEGTPSFLIMRRRQGKAAILRTPLMREMVLKFHAPECCFFLLLLCTPPPQPGLPPKGLA